jgi:hypothetical protein
MRESVGDRRDGRPLRPSPEPSGSACLRVCAVGGLGRIVPVASRLRSTSHRRLYDTQRRRRRVRPVSVSTAQQATVI